LPWATKPSNDMQSPCPRSQRVFFAELGPKRAIQSPRFPLILSVSDLDRLQLVSIPLASPILVLYASKSLLYCAGTMELIVEW